MKITNITSKEILDSKGVPTLETTITLDNQTTAKTSVPSGSSTGIHEAHELRDEDPNRHNGKGVLLAVKNVNEVICHYITNKDFNSQEELDNALISIDGTEDKSGLGANAILSVSMAYCRAVAQHKNIELYQYLQEISGQKELTTPQMNILVMEGGKHGDWATDIQEYMIIPKKEKFPEVQKALEVAKNITQSIKNILIEKKYKTNLGMEGGFSPRELKSNKEPLEIIASGIEKSGYKPGDDVMIGLDVAASEFYKDNIYTPKHEKKNMNTNELIECISKLVNKFPISYIEDPLSEDDWDGWKKITEILGSKYQIVGDDLLTTNPERIKRGIQEKAMNSMIIKPNQIGTITETIEAIKLAESSNVPTIISHRGGETQDSFIADLVAGTQSNQTKFGAVTKEERLAKYYRLMKIYSGTVHNLPNQE